MNTFEILLLIGAVQGFFLSTLLFAHKENKSANTFLGIASLALSIELTFIILNIKSVYQDYPHIIGLTFPLAFIYGPTFYIYVKLLTSPDKVFHKKYLIHFFPLMLALIYYSPNYFLSAEAKLVLNEAILNNSLLDINFINDIKPLHGITYMIVMVLYVNGYVKKIKNSFSNIERINLSWLRYLAFAMVVITIILIIQHAFEFMNKDQTIMQNILFLSLAALVYSFGYLGLKQPEIFSQTDKAKINEKIEGNDERYKKSGLNEDIALDYVTKLEELMIEEKPYLDCNLTLQQLADKMEISTHNLSEIINSKLNQNYYDFINKYRVDEFIELLENDSDKKYKIITLAFESGFNSKSTFNSIFKKFTGKTPSEFRKIQE